MSFVESLRRVTNNLKDSKGIALVGMDGIVVEEHKKDPTLDLQSLGAEYSAMMREVQRVNSSLQIGDVREVSVLNRQGDRDLPTTQQRIFSCLSGEPEGNLGKGRFLIRREIATLEKEL
jgi:predicted regulator of Ras-like GTPase activity (Roadblock/LC7/MglB family)